MKKVLWVIIYALRAIWELPQNLVGAVIFIVEKCKKHRSYKFETSIVAEWDHPYGLSLGCFIFIWKNADESSLLHEWGHSLQSMLLGWLYLLVIGLPSAIWCNCFDNYRRKYKVSYYKFYPEAWANAWAGLDKNGFVKKGE